MKKTVRNRIKKVLVNLVVSLIWSKPKRHAVRNVLLGPPMAWESYALSRDIPAAMSAMRRGLDDKSLALFDLTCARKMLFSENDPWSVDCQIRLAYLNSLDVAESLEYLKIYEAELSQYRADFWLYEGAYYAPETFTYHSGLRNKATRLKKYISGKDFIDGGAYIGDSVLVYLRYYNPHKVWSFEISEKNRAAYKTTMQMNSIMPDKYELCPHGLSDRRHEIFIDDSGHLATSVLVTGSSKALLVDLDSFALENNLNIGFIKTDVEGHGLECLFGMTETIRRDRPVLSLSIYHTPQEFFEVKPALDEITVGLDYKITLAKHNPFSANPCNEIFETTVFAYPRELDDEG